MATIQVKRGDLAGASSTSTRSSSCRRPTRPARTSRTSRAWRSRASSTSGRSSTRRSRPTCRSRASRSTGRRRCASRPGRTSRPRTGSGPTGRSTCCCSPTPTPPTRPTCGCSRATSQLRMSNFYLASDAFSKVRDEFEPVHRQLQQVIVKSQTDPGLLRLAGRQEPRQVRHRRVRAADRRQVGEGRARRRAHDVAGHRRRRDAARPRRQPEAGRAHRARHAGQRAGSGSSRTSRRRAPSRSRSMNQVVDTRQKFVRQDPRASSTRPDARGAQAARPARHPARRPRAAAHEPADHRRGRSSSTSAR